MNELSANKLAAVSWAKDRMAEDFVIVDLETSGWGNGFKSEIVQIGIVSKAGDILLDALVKPLREIQPQAVEVHGITMERVANAATFNDLWHAIRQIIDGRQKVAYNADFEWRILDDQLHNAQMGQGHRKDWQCAMLAYAQYHGEWNPRFKSWKYQKLVTACKTFDVNLENAHSAAADALATLEVIKAMADAN